MFKRNKSHSQSGGIAKKLFKDEATASNFSFSSNKYHSNIYIQQIQSDSLRLSQKIMISNSVELQPRGKSLSSSSKQLFRNAHSVQKEESFLRGKNKLNTIKWNKTSMGQLKQQIQEIRSLKKKIERTEQVLQRKLVISNVISASVGPSKLSMKEQLARLKAKHNIEQQTKNVLKLSKSKIFQVINANNPHKDSIDKNNSNIKSNVLQYSKVVEEEGSHDFIQSGVKNNQSRADRFEMNRQELKMCISEMSSSLKQSIREELEGVYNNKQADIQQKYQQKLNEYQDKIAQVQAKMANRQQKIIAELTTKFESRIKQIKTEKQSNKQTVSLEGQVKDLKKKETLFDGPPIGQSKSKQTVLKQPNNNKLSNKVDEIVVEEVQTFDRRSAKPDQKKQLKTNMIKQVKKGSVKGDNKQKSMRSKNVGEGNGSEDQIEQIKLSLESKNVDLKGAKNMVSLPRNVDRSFNMAKQLDDSFESVQPVQTFLHDKNTKQDKVKKTKQVEKSKTQMSLRQSQIEEQEKKKKEKQLKTNELKKILLKQVQNDGFLSALGEVAGYCSKLMKKSKLNWRTPALFLYRYCYDSYRRQTPINEQGLKLGLLKKQQVQSFQKQNELLKQNLQKLHKAVQKKVILPAEYSQMIQSEDEQLNRLIPIIEKQVKEFINVIEQSQEMADISVLQCGLRMMNGVFIIRNLTMDKHIQVLTKIEQMKEKDIKQTFDRFADLLFDNN